MAAKQAGNSLREEKVLEGYLRNWNKKQQVPVQRPRGFHGCEADRKFSARRKGCWEGTCGTGMEVHRK